jgi:hypothetical protein
MEEETNQSNNKGNLKTIRTYLSDMADTVRSNDISVIKVALAEQNKNERENIYRQAEGTPVKKAFWVIGGIALIAIALFGIYFVTNKNANLNTPEIIVKDESVISYDELSTLETTDTSNLTDKILTNIKDVSSRINNTGIESISINNNLAGVKNKIGIKELFTKLEFTAPSSLVRSLSDSFMVGTYTKISSGTTTENKPGLFLILQTKDYEYTYAGMLEWEKTMASDMFYLFELNTKENKIEVNDRQWKDIIINNKDARVLYNEDKLPILYYMFTDKSNIIIANKEDTIKEIVSRLIIKNIKPL